MLWSWLAILVAALVSLGIHGASSAVNHLFEGRSHTLIAIAVGYDTVALAVARAILAAMG